MGKGLLFFCCACCILVLTIINLSIGPIISGKVGNDAIGTLNFYWGTANCKMYADLYDADTNPDNVKKYSSKRAKDECTRKKAMHDMEYTSFIFDIVIGFVCGLLGLLHIFDLKKDFVSNTGLIGLICGVVGFVLSLVYIIFNGIVYTTYYDYSNQVFKRDGDGVFAEWKGDKYECLYFDKVENEHSYYATYADLIKKQYNYQSDFYGDAENGCIGSPSNCVRKEYLSIAIQPNILTTSECKKLYVSEETEITNKDISDRFLTALILSLFVCLANIGLALFGFLLFRTPGDF